MTTFFAITSHQAAEFVENAGIPEPRRFIVDFAAAGLLKTYADTIETTEAYGDSKTVRGATIPPRLWKRIVKESVSNEVWVGGSVRLAGCGLKGGSPEVWITGVTFNEPVLRRVVARHSGRPPERTKRTSRSGQATETIDYNPDVRPEVCRPQPDPATIPVGAMLATIRQTQGALGLGRTKIYQLIKAGRLVRREIDGGVRIEVASILALAGSR